MKAKVWRAKTTDVYMKRLLKMGYRVGIEFDADGIHYYTVQVYSDGDFIGQYSTPRQAWEKLHNK